MNKCTEQELSVFKQLSVQKKYNFLLETPEFKDIVLPNIQKPMASQYADMVYQKKEFISESALPSDVLFKFTLGVQPYYLYLTLREFTHLDIVKFKNTYFFDGNSLPDEIFLIKMCFILAPSNTLVSMYRRYATISTTNNQITTNNGTMTIENETLFKKYYDHRKFDLDKVFKFSLTTIEKQFINQLNNDIVIYSFFDSKFFTLLLRFKKTVQDLGENKAKLSTCEWYNDAENMIATIAAICRKLKDADPEGRQIFIKQSAAKMLGN